MFIQNLSYSYYVLIVSNSLIRVSISNWFYGL